MTDLSKHISTMANQILLSRQGHHYPIVHSQLNPLGLFNPLNSPTICLLFLPIPMKTLTKTFLRLVKIHSETLIIKIRFRNSLSNRWTLVILRTRKFQ